MLALTVSGAAKAVQAEHPLLLHMLWHGTGEPLPCKTAQEQEQRALAYFFGVQAVLHTPGALDAMVLGLCTKLLAHIAPMVEQLAEVTLEDEEASHAA